MVGRARKRRQQRDEIRSGTAWKKAFSGLSNLRPDRSRHRELHEINAGEVGTNDFVFEHLVNRYTEPSVNAKHVAVRAEHLCIHHACSPGLEAEPESDHR